MSSSLEELSAVALEDARVRREKELAEFQIKHLQDKAYACLVVKQCGDPMTRAMQHLHTVLDETAPLMDEPGLACLQATKQLFKDGAYVDAMLRMRPLVLFSLDLQRARERVLRLLI